MFEIVYYVYLPITVVLYGTSAILLKREDEKREDFQPMLFGGTYNVILYYRYLKKRNERLSKRFWFYIIATTNLILCMIIFTILFFTG